MLRACDNPFAVHRVLRVRYELDAAEWRTLLDRFATLSHRGAIIGPHGTGKTTLLEDSAVQLAEQGWRPHWVRLNAESRQIGKLLRPVANLRLGRFDAVFVDGAEQIPVLTWQVFRWRVRHAGALMITTLHPGRLPALHVCTTTPDLLRRIVQRLGEDITPGDAAALHARHRGNLRDALRELYDRCAAAPQPK